MKDTPIDAGASPAPFLDFLDEVVEADPNPALGFQGCVGIGVDVPTGGVTWWVGRFDGEAHVGRAKGCPGDADAAFRMDAAAAAGLMTSGAIPEGAVTSFVGDLDVLRRFLARFVAPPLGLVQARGPSASPQRMSGRRLAE